jgi:hypothetical protein
VVKTALQKGVARSGGLTEVVHIVFGRMDLRDQSNLKHTPAINRKMKSSLRN